MPTRKAILISYPGELGQDNYCKGVNKDMQEYLALLKSPFGGLWYADEIAFLYRPSLSDMKEAIQTLPDYDYSLVVFSGLGRYSAESQSTVLQLNNSEIIDSNELRNGSEKQTIILDCCRKVEEILLADETIFAEAARSRPVLNESECRRYYDKQIEESSPGLIVLHACGAGETSGDDSEKGGYYSHSLIRSVEEWVGHNNVDVSKSYDILSVPSAHERAYPKIQESSGGRQNPRIEKPRTQRHFPFAVVA
jgi:hypothetical protein